MNFWSDCYENSHQLQDILTNFKFFTMCVDNDKQDNGGQNSSMAPKLEIFTTPCCKH
jgi:hypothetical protein